MNWTQGWQTWEALPGVVLDVFHLSGSMNNEHTLITGGIHGDEYEGPAAIAALVASLDPAKVKGTITAIPVANPPAFLAGTRTNPDGFNLARCFPGRNHASATEQLAEAIFSRLSTGVTHLIDLHSGGVEYNFLPVTGFYGDPSPANHSFLAAQLFGLPALWKLPETDGVLSFEAHRRGVTAIGAEYLGMGQLSTEGVAAYRAGIERCLAAWRIYDRPFERADPARVFLGDWQLASTDGLIHNSVELGQAVECGQPLCQIMDLRGKVIQEFCSTRKGIIGGLRSKAHIREGNWAVLVLEEHHAA